MSVSNIMCESRKTLHTHNSYYIQMAWIYIYFKVVNKIVFLNYQKLCTFFFFSENVCVYNKMKLKFYVHVVWYGVSIWRSLLCMLYIVHVYFVWYANPKNMPSSMVKYVSKKYLCANNEMRNERHFEETTHIMLNTTTLNQWKSIENVKLTEKYVIYVITRMC